MIIGLKSTISRWNRTIIMCACLLRGCVGVRALWWVMLLGGKKERGVAFRGRKWRKGLCRCVCLCHAVRVYMCQCSFTVIFYLSLDKKAEYYQINYCKTLCLISWQKGRWPLQSIHISSVIIFHPWYHSFCSQVPGGNFVLVGTHSDELYAEDKRSGQSRRVLGALTTRTAQYTKVFKEEIANIE